MDEAIEKILLMIVLAFVYCKKKLTDSKRWWSTIFMYNLLQSVDERKSKLGNLEKLKKSSMESKRGFNLVGNEVAVVLLVRFMLMSYLLMNRSIGFQEKGR